MTKVAKNWLLSILFWIFPEEKKEESIQAPRTQLDIASVMFSCSFKQKANE